MSGPPRRFEALLRRVLPPRDREAILGDLAEAWEGWKVGEGRRSADTRYRLEVLRSLLPAALRRVRSVAGPGEVGIVRDVRHALRSLARQPGFAVATLPTLGLGVGAVVAVFAVFHGVLVRPLPYPEPDGLHMLYQQEGGSIFWTSAPNYRDLRERLESFEELAAYSPDGANMVVDGEPGRVATAEVTANFFATLGVRPVEGRAFTEEEVREDARVAVVSHGVARRFFGGAAGARGGDLILDDRAYRVVGVLPPGPALPSGTEVWLPISMDAPDWRTRRGIGWILVVGRLRPGVTPEMVRDELDAAAGALAEAHPAVNEGMEIALRSLEETIVGDVRTPLRVLMAGVGVILLVVCTNVSGLLVARSVSRRREVALRRALGGGRGRIAGQLLTEGAVLALLGGALGLALAHLGLRGLLALAPAETPRIDEVGIGGPALLLTLAVVTGVALLCALLPALQLREGAPLDALREREGGEPPRVGLLRRGLVSVQVALAVVLVCSSALLGRSLWNLRRVDPGFDPRGVLVAGLPVVETAFASVPERVAYHQRVEERVAAVPGVEGAALVNAVPLRDAGPTFSYELRDAPERPGDDLLARYRVVTPGAFDALGIPFVSGRGFTADEAAAGGPRAMVVDETFEAAHFPGGALGREVRILDEWWTVVGVVGALRDRSLEGTPTRQIFVPLARASRQSMRLVVRTPGDPASLMPDVRRAVAEVAPRQPLSDPGPLTRWVDGAVAQPRFSLWILGFFGGSAVLLAALGLYGLLAYAVARRTREIGVRMSLGAGARTVRRMIATQGMTLVAAGLLAGLVLAWLGTPLLGELLFRVDPRQPSVYVAVATVLGLVGLGAAWIPAVRATRIDPSKALRGE